MVIIYFIIWGAGVAAEWLVAVVPAHHVSDNTSGPPYCSMQI